MKKPLQHSAVLSMPGGASIWCSCSLYISFLNSSCSAYGMYLGGT